MQIIGNHHHRHRSVFMLSKTAKFKVREAADRRHRGLITGDQAVALLMRKGFRTHQKNE